MSATLNEYVARYVCTADHNDQLFMEFTAATWNDPVLSTHRQHVEAHRLGFGDPACHYMWRLLLEEAACRFSRPRCLEIGVYKGQIVSLWALLASRLRLPVELDALTPLQGNPLPPDSVWRSLRARLSPRFREQLRNGNFYPDDDYEACIRSLFANFDLSWDSVRLWRGFSTDSALLRTLPTHGFHVVYVDGDHTYSGASADVRNFGPRVVNGGWLVMDDASSDVPGTVFWKGHESVARACRLLPEMGFRNILNIGHNRVFERNV